MLLSNQLKVKKMPGKKKRKFYKKPWYSNSCHDLRNTVKNYEKLLNKFPDNGFYRKSFYTFKSKYRRTCKYEAHMYKQKIVNTINNSLDKDPKTFWDLLNNLDKLHSTKNSSDDLPYQLFFDFYKNLNKGQSSHNDFQENILNQTKNLIDKLPPGTCNYSDNFNKCISVDEIAKCITKLKPGKSTSNDLIANEMLKNGGALILKPLEKLFNFIFNSGNFPKNWNESFLVLLHKKGCKTNPNNYRGISITSNLGKLFNRVIHGRILSFINEKSLLSENQIGFKEGSRTADHIFTLKSIVDDYKRKNKKVFAAFIDLRKAFDTIWRFGLFYKLLNLKFPDKILKLIISMYENTSTRIKFLEGLSESFISECGVKQGDILSPTLFNIFIDDLVSDLNTNKCDPVHINDLSINCLLYADDIVLLSESENGLQSSLDVLSTFCSNWKLQVNVDKSKIIVFNSNGKSHINRFNYDNAVLQTVQKYCYLGITLKYNGNFNLATSVLMEKARKAWFKVKKTIGLDNPCKLLEKLFDTLVTPILLYCCEVWGVDISTDDTSLIEKFHSKFIKEILGVHCKTTNAACRAELGRLNMKSRISVTCIKYLNHIMSSSNTLVHKIFQATKPTNKWFEKIKKLLNHLGFSYIIERHNPFKPLLPCLKQRITDQGFQEQRSQIFNSNKLLFYRNFYKNNRSEYVDILKNKSERSTLSQLRLSAHCLEIEKGRHQSLPLNERKCKICNNGSIEDENHFLFQCEGYTNLRQTFIHKIGTTSYKISTEKWISYLDSNSINILKTIAKYIKDCLVLRNNLLDNLPL